MNALEINEVDEHIFNITNLEDYRPVFRDKRVRDDFNLGLKKIKENRTFQKIYDNYMEP
ncbi:hypothetical protein [Cognaticolwellia mytili]|uniref:hypothetical protein n=1 Tax=Cognaticolwellia mytili TaxID=1888913 RepID=UPI0038B36E36